MPEVTRGRRRLGWAGAATALALAVTIPGYTAYAAGSPPPAKPRATTTRHSSTPATTPHVTPYSPPAAPDGVTPSRPKTITASSHFSVKVDPSGTKPSDTTWPSAAEVFTRSELQQVLPKLTAVTATQCRTGSLPDGGSTHLSTACTLDLTIAGEPADDRSKLLVNIRGFGLPQQIGRQWSRDLAYARSRSAKRPGLYTFYANKSLGAAAAFTDGTTTEVLLQHGKVAGEIWFSGIGFTTLTSDYLRSRKLFRQTIVPALVQLLAAKLTAQ